MIKKINNCCFNDLTLESLLFFKFKCSARAGLLVFVNRRRQGEGTVFRFISFYFSFFVHIKYIFNIRLLCVCVNQLNDVNNKFSNSVKDFWSLRDKNRLCSFYRRRRSCSFFFTFTARGIQTIFIMNHLELLCVHKRIREQYVCFLLCYVLKYNS